jgi:1-acyl-sn-glycerol-3-phosphate acyltransferase
VIFPEGGNFTPRRRLRAIRLLEERRLAEEAAKARAMEHLLPPKPGGALAAIAAAPTADVIFVAHTGLEHVITVATSGGPCPWSRSSRPAGGACPPPRSPKP